MLTDELRSLGAPRILRYAARDGHITELACAMPKCSCPKGRTYFEQAGARGPWIPTPDRWPTPGLVPVVANCVRWNIKRGKPCTCGTHQATA